MKNAICAFSLSTAIAVGLLHVFVDPDSPHRDEGVLVHMTHEEAEYWAYFKESNGYHMIFHPEYVWPCTQSNSTNVTEMPLRASERPLSALTNQPIPKAG